ncbi:MAG: histidine phosphatase family protein [Anaerolineae bacterium]
MPGKTSADFEARFANLVLPDSLDHTGWWNRPVRPTTKRLSGRSFLADLKNIRHGGTNDRVAVVTHGAFYNRVLAALLKVPYREAGWWFGLNNTGLTRIDFYENEFEK